MSRSTILFLLCLAFPAVAWSEDNCGTMLRTMTRFRGTVRSVEMLESLTSATFMPVDFDIHFVVSIDVDEKTQTFGIHSPSRTFGPDPIVGQTFDLEAERMDCDGAFRRFLMLQRQIRSKPERFDGRLEVGRVYRAEVTRTPEGELALVKRLALPMHHFGGIEWLNPEAVKGDDIVFEVVSVRIEQQAEWEWLSEYKARVLDPASLK